MWSSSTAGIASVSAGTVTGVSAGAATVTYSLSNSCGSADTTFGITVNPLPDAGVVSGADSLCIGDTTTYVTSGSSGAWSSSNVSVAIVSSAGFATAIATGSATISYSATNICGSATSSHGLVVRSITDCPTEVANVGELYADLAIFPNPNNGTFTISLPAHANAATIDIIDLHGRTIKTISVSDRKTTIPVDLSHFAAGVYMAKVMIDNTVYYRKVVVM